MDLKTAFLVIGYNRPRYLYICLDAIHRINGIDKDNIMVWVDGGGNKENEIKRIINEFEIKKYKIRENNLGILKNITYSIKEVFERFNYNEVFYIENDLLVRSDILQFLDKTPRDAFFLNVAGNQEMIVQKHYRNFGNLILRNNFYELFAYIENKEYYGKLRIGPNGIKPSVKTILGGNTQSHDSVYQRFVNDKNKTTRFSDQLYVGHFGIRGVNTKGNTDIETKIFSGERQQWIQNVIRIFENAKRENNYPFGLLPKGFEYV